MQQQSFSLRDNQPLIAVPVEEHGTEVIRYYADDAAADADLTDLEQLLIQAGAPTWRQLDWDAIEGKLADIRHHSRPSNPISL